MGLSLIDWLRQFSKEKEENFIRGFLGRMLFSGEESLKSCKVLSGGEKVRCMLSRMMLVGANVLLLDEPTNHLDAESVHWLEQHLDQYKGTVICITHDRYFLDNVAGWILELDRGEGIPYKGNYTNWLEQKSARLAQEEKRKQKPNE